jgi:hypothetical protein
VMAASSRETVPRFTRAQAKAHRLQPMQRSRFVTRVTFGISETSEKLGPKRDFAFYAAVKLRENPLLVFRKSAAECEEV